MLLRKVMEPLESEALMELGHWRQPVAAQPHLLSTLFFLTAGGMWVGAASHSHHQASLIMNCVLL